MAGIGSAFQGFFGQGPAAPGMTGIRSTAQGGGSFGGLTSLIPGYDPGRPIAQPTGMVGIAPAPRPMMPTMGTAIRGMFGGGRPAIDNGFPTFNGQPTGGGMLGGGASIAPRPPAMGGAIGSVAPMLGGGGGHVVGAWGQAHPEILAQRQAARRAARGVL